MDALRGSTVKRGGLCSSPVSFVHFDVRGKEFSLPLEVLDYHPDSYVAWVVQNNLESVRLGRPIMINKNPESFKNLLKSLSVHQSERGSDWSYTDVGTSNLRLKSAQQMLAEKGASALLPPPPPPPPGNKHLGSSQPSVTNQQQGAFRPKTPYEAFNLRNLKHQTASSSSASTLHQFDGESADSREMEGRTLAPTASRIKAPKDTGQIVQESVEGILEIIRRYANHRQMFDKALIVLRWGFDSDGGRVLRPCLSKLYESMTGRVHDARRSSEGSGSLDRHANQGQWGAFQPMPSETCISSRQQNLIVEFLRSAGYASSFSDVKLDKNGVVDWRGGRRDTHTGGMQDGASVRCLVVHFR